MHRVCRPAILVACLAGLHCIVAGTAAANSVEAWTSSADGQQRLAQLPPLALERKSAAGRTGGALLSIHVDPKQGYQQIEGFGASITDASAELIQATLSPAARASLLRELLDARTGLGFSLTRVPIGASDFSREHYSFNDMPVGQVDPGLQHFSAAPHERYVFPLLREMRDVQRGLRVFVSPWSAPGWMKTSDSMLQGSLREEAYQPYAHYLLRSVQAFEAAGVPVFALTMQNEPSFVPTNYPGMKMTPAERVRFTSAHLGPLLARSAPRLRLLEWDHNWDDPQSPLAVLGDPAAARYFAGTAWHCYAGEPAAQSQVHDAFPAKETWFTECAGGGWSPNWGETLQWMARQLVIGSLRNWAQGVIMWNLALDENSGPHRGGCGNCRGVVTIDSRTGAITRNVEYYVLGHASRFVQRGARRIASDSDRDGLHTVAFRNPQRGSLVLIVLNAANAERRFEVVAPGARFEATIAAGSVTTYRWR